MNKIIYALLGVVLLATVALGQNGGGDDPKQPGAGLPQDIRVNVLRQLGLSQEQMQRIRRLNMARKPMLDDAQKQLGQAMHALDEAIYADAVVEPNIQARLKDVQLAQAEVARLRFMNELAVRRILTPEQLIRFRELRRRFGAIRPNGQDGRGAEKAGVKGVQDSRVPTRQVSNPGAKRPNF